MDSRAVACGAVVPGAQYSERGTVAFQGREYTANGAWVSDLRLIAYLGPGGTVTTWQGETIGRYSVSGKWRTPRSFMSTTRESVSILLTDGRRYVGRSFGEGTIVHARRAACDVSRWPRGKQ